VKGTVSLARSLNSTRKNWSCAFAVWKNFAAASAALRILSCMLPLMSSNTPTEIGASSLAK
jgi:hypothetical protein